ncbi:MAG: DUF3024 domain-containing protein [Polaromonas sp.]|nr:DUF3024 domain-containing protein [Polaromonas sp.]
MDLTELECKRCEKSLTEFIARRRPPLHIRGQLDIGYRIEGRSVEIFEIRPDRKDACVRHESPVAKATFVRTKGIWKVFWMRSDLKWHSYEPKAKVNTLKEFLGAVDRDEHSCFFS